MKEGFPTENSEGHLTKGIKPIMACIGSLEDFKEAGQKPDYKILTEQLKNEGNINVQNVNFYGLYTFSVLDKKNKYSNEFFDCTGLIVTGIDKETGKNISFLSHQDPKKFLFDKKDDFIKQLKQRLDEVKNRCLSGTIDAVIIGGKYNKYIKNTTRKIYLDSIELLSLEIKKVLGFEPGVIIGPKTLGGQDDVYYDNENRRLYFVRENIDKDVGSFTYSDVEEEKKKWEKDTKGIPPWHSES